MEIREEEGGAGTQIDYGRKLTRCVTTQNSVVHCVTVQSSKCE